MSTAKELKKEIERGVWDASLGKLYGRRAGVLERQRARYADALDRKSTRLNSSHCG